MAERKEFVSILDDLTPLHRQIMEHVLLGRSNPEIAEVLGLPRGIVAVAREAARRTLRRKNPRLRHD